MSQVGAESHSRKQMTVISKYKNHAELANDGQDTPF